MITQNKSFQLLAVLFLPAILSIICCSPISADEGQGNQQVVAEVNGQEITKRELSNRARIDYVFLALRSAPTFASFLMRTEEGEETLDDYRAYVLEKLIEEELMIQKSDDLGINISEDEVNHRLQGIIDQTKGVSNRSELREALKQDRRSIEDLKQEIFRKLVREKIRGALLKDVEITEEEIRNYYQENKSSFRDSQDQVKEFSEVRVVIKEELAEGKSNKVWNEWLEKVKADARIKRFLG